jgi:hypothetical protein
MEVGWQQKEYLVAIHGEEVDMILYQKKKKNNRYFECSREVLE